jgi:Sec-independent protein translocase protein TatA
MSISHLIILGIIILIAVPPEKLPEIMRNIGRLIGDLKRQTNGIFSEISTDLKKDIKLTPQDMLKKITENLPETQATKNE